MSKSDLSSSNKISRTAFTAGLIAAAAAATSRGEAKITRGVSSIPASPETIHDKAVNYAIEESNAQGYKLGDDRVRDIINAYNDNLKRTMPDEKDVRWESAFVGASAALACIVMASTYNVAKSPGERSNHVSKAEKKGLVAGTIASVLTGLGTYGVMESNEIKARLETSAHATVDTFVGGTGFEGIPAQKVLNVISAYNSSLEKQTAALNNGMRR